MAAGKILIDLLLATGSFEVDSKRAARQLRELKKEATEAGKVIGAGLVVASTAAAAFVKSAIDSADAASKAAQSAGITTEAFTGLSYAADLAGVSQEDLGKVFSKLNTDIAKNDETLRKLGVGLTDSAGKARAAEDVLGDLADRFAGMADGPAKAALAAQVFGEKIGPKLIPFLNQGKAGLAQLREEARRLGVEISTETGKKAEEFNDDLSRLSKQAQGLALRVATDVLPSLLQLSERFVQNAKDAGLLEGAFITLFERVFGGTEVSDVAARQAEALKASIVSLEEEMTGAVERNDSKRAAILSAEITRLEAQRKAIEGMAAALAKPEAAKPPQPGGPPGNGFGKDKVSEAERYTAALVQQIIGLQDLTSAERALADINAGRVKGATVADQERIKVLAGQVDFLRAVKEAEQGAADARKRAADVVAGWNASAAQANEVLETSNAALRLEISLIGKSADERTRLEQAKLSDTIAGKESELMILREAGARQEQIDALTREIELLKERRRLLGQKTDLELRNIEPTLEPQVRGLTDAARDLGMSFHSAFEDAIVGGKKASEVVRAFEQDLLRIMSRKLIIEPLANSATSWVQGLFGAWGSGGMSQSGGVDPAGINHLSGSGATGVETQKGRSYWVGEDGPELFVPRTAGSVVPQGSGGNVTVINNGSPVKARTERGADGTLKVILDAVDAHITQDYARGGRISRAQTAVFGSQRGPQLTR